MAERLAPQNDLPTSVLQRDVAERVSLSVSLFGSFEARIGENPLPRLRSRRGQWLLALLLLRAGRSVERSWLAGTLWPDSTEENALVSLRQTLTDLRHALGPERERLASPTSRTLSFDAAGAFVDVVAFDAAFKRGDPASLQEAVRLHHRPLLDDCHEEWVPQEREHREQACLTALLTLANEALAAGRLEEAAASLRRIVTADPFREDARRGLMNALARTGNPGEAVWVYRDLRLLMQRELRAEPSAETRALYAQIRREARRPLEASDGDVTPVDAPVAPQRPPAVATTGLLPKPLTDLIGRESDIAEISSRLFRSRLVSLLGMGGVGKTRLAIQVAGAWAEDQPEGVAFVDLAPLTDVGQTARAVAGVLGIPEDPRRPLVESLVDALRERRFLLVLDNCEHLLDACAHLAARLLLDCPALVILTTSRQALGVMGEVGWPVSPLSLPSGAEKMSADVVSRSAAVRLFVDRASAVLPDFACTESNAAAITEICVRLDGVPLALELAAARVRVLTPAQIAERLNDRFGLLSQGSRAVLPRQQTLRALIDWSYDLLSEPERHLLGRCSVFAGSWDLEAAEAVCADTGEETVDVLDALAGLVDKSLVQVVSEDGSDRRYRLLETVRQYARERLGQETEADAALRRHRDWFLALTVAAQPHFRGEDQIFWLNRLEREHDNLRTAIDYCRREATGLETQLHLTSGLWRFWMGRGYFAEGRGHLTAALERSAGVDVDAGLRIKALNGAAAMAWHQGDLPAARVWMEEGLHLARQKGDLADLDPSLNNLGAVVYSQGDFATARVLWEEALAIRRSLKDEEAVSSSLNNLGYLAHSEGDVARAEALHQEALDMTPGLKNRHKRRSSLVGLANIQTALGDYKTAQIYLEEALSLARDIDDKDCICGSLTELGKIAVKNGDMAQAGSYLQEALTVAQATGMMPAMIGGMEAMIELFLTSGEAHWAARLCGAVEAHRRLLGLPVQRSDYPSYEKIAAAVRAALGPEAAEADWNEGRGLRLEAAVAWALERSADYHNTITTAGLPSN